MIDGFKNPNVKSFTTFFEEKNAPKDDDYNMVILHILEDDSPTVKRLEEECKKKNITFFNCLVDGAYVEEGILYARKSEKGFELTDNTVVMVLGDLQKKNAYLNFLSELERVGCTLVNSRRTIEVCSDKYRTYLNLKNADIEQPKTVLIPNKDAAEDALEKLGSKFPIILKTTTGSKGVGVIFIESERSYNATVQLLYKIDDDVELLIQEYIKTDGDIRVLVLGKTIIASMKRHVIDGDFRSNYSQGGKVSKYNLSDLEKEKVLLAAKKVNGKYVGVDFIPTKDGPRIIEVNHSPGSQGIEKATGPVIDKVVDYWSDPKHRVHTPEECGFLEVINVHPFGPIISKFDSGNSSLPVIHGEKIQYDDKNKIVHWILFGKKMSRPLDHIMKVNLGGLRDYSEKRYVVKLDIDFAGKTYKDVSFTIDDRKSRTRILLNRDLMVRMNVMVNPQRKYVLTNKIESDRMKDNESTISKSKG